MKKATELMFATIKAGVFGDGSISIPEKIDEETLKKLYSLSSKHDIAHIVAAVLEKNSALPDGEIKNAFGKQKMLAVFRREQQNFEFARICAVLEEAQIDYIPLKGSVIKNFYPEEWMRTSSDIDILIKPERLDEAVNAITEKPGFRFDAKSRHDCRIRSNSGVNLELHFAIKSSFEKLDNVFEGVWNYAVSSKDGIYRFDLTNEFLIFYSIAHMKYHFSSGGCGVRPFIDLKLLENALDYSKEGFSKLIIESECMEFYNGISALSKVWLENGQHSELTEIMEEFLLTGGVFGTRSNLGAADRYLKGSKFKYLLSRVFATKERLGIMYPTCAKYPFLMPFYQVKRWFRLLKKDILSAAKDELTGENKIEPTALMMKELGF